MVTRMKRDSCYVNDVHAGVNRCLVKGVVTPSTLDELRGYVRALIESSEATSVSGERHSMGGQQFAEREYCLDSRRLDRVLFFDGERGLVCVEAGMSWGALITALRDLQCAQERGKSGFWTIRQKPTGADGITLGGSVSSNIHGRGLTMKPFVEDIESIEVVGSDGEVRVCSREINAHLFSLIVGGYGCFGVVYSVTLRLVRAQWLRRDVREVTSSGLIKRFESLIEAGAVYGDFQFSIDSQSDDFMRKGVMACYVPVEEPVDSSEPVKALSEEDVAALLSEAHADAGRAFARYVRHYLATDGAVYSSDLMQLSAYPKGYHQAGEYHLCKGGRGSEMITELYVPHEHIENLLDRVAHVLRRRSAQLIYGTVRLIRGESETFLPWARGERACVVLNLHIDHDEKSLAAARTTFQMLIDVALEMGGSFYLTYHPWARKDQLERAYPEIRDWIRERRILDPKGLFTSDWVRGLDAMLLEKMEPVGVFD